MSEPNTSDPLPKDDEENEQTFQLMLLIFVVYAQGELFALIRHIGRITD
jgi:hypothetical protein